jgi:hypothetical protein
VFRFALIALVVMGVSVTAALGWQGVLEGVRHVARRLAEPLGRVVDHGPIGSRSAKGKTGVVAPPAPTPPAVPPTAPVIDAPRPPRAPPPLVPSTTEAAPPASVRTTPIEPAPRIPGAQASSPSARGQDTESSRTFEESRLVAPALKDLRDQQPEKALEQLRIYEARFHHGYLEGEAALIEVQADLALGLDDEALRQLEALAFDDFRDISRPDEARLLRAELLSRRNACGRALIDFDRLLSDQLEATIEQRALYGRAVCRSAVGDAAGGRADAARYLSRFPDGQFAAAARQLAAGATP